MTGATHFIEVWKNREGLIKSTLIDVVSNLPMSIRITKHCNLTTIAIWKIKFKTKDNGTITRELNG